MKCNFFRCIDLKSGWNALMEACFKGHKEVVEVLIAAKANVDIQDKVRGGG